MHVVRQGVSFDRNRTTLACSPCMLVLHIKTGILQPGQLKQAASGQKAWCCQWESFGCSFHLVFNGKDYLTWLHCCYTITCSLGHPSICVRAWMHLCEAEVVLRTYKHDDAFFLMRNSSVINPWCQHAVVFMVGPHVHGFHAWAFTTSCTCHHFNIWI